MTTTLALVVHAEPKIDPEYEFSEVVGVFSSWPKAHAFIDQEKMKPDNASKNFVIEPFVMDDPTIRPPKS